MVRIRSFVVQLIGALYAIDKNPDVNQLGLHVYTAGVALQEFFILCFSTLAIIFLRRLPKESVGRSVSNARRLMFVLFAALALISVSLSEICILVLEKSIFPRTARTKDANHRKFVQLRIVYRIIEFSGGFGNKLTAEIVTHEAYQYGFDTLPMFLAIIIFHILHPGVVLEGPESQWPGRKGRKAMRQEEGRINDRDGADLDFEAAKRAPIV